MQDVSESYNPYPPERRSDMRVTFELVDVDAAEDASAIVSSEAAISKIEQTHNRILAMEKKLATLEFNQFTLDGSFSLPSETENGEVGWWSGKLSDSNGILGAPQVLEFAFIKEQSSIGFMVIFDEKADEAASDFRLQVFNAAEELIAEDIVTGNTEARYILELPADGYKKVRLTFEKTAKPNRRVRVSEVVFGIIQSFTKANTTGLRLLYEVSPEMKNLLTCPPKVAPVSKLVINWYTDFERMGKLWQGKTIRWSRSS